MLHLRFYGKCHQANVGHGKCHQENHLKFRMTLTSLTHSVYIVLLLFRADICPHALRENIIQLLDEVEQNIAIYHISGEQISLPSVSANN